MSRPTGTLPVPRELASRYADWHWEIAWHNVSEAIAYRLTSRSGAVRFTKLTVPGWHPSLEAEARRMSWAGDHLPVPTVLDRGSETDVDWLVTGGLPGVDATHPSLQEDTEELVRILARGLRAFHAAPVEPCPFDFRLEAAFAHVRRRLGEGRIHSDPDFHEEFAHLTAEQAIDRLERSRPESESLVVCHGDYCLPNVLVSGGEATGFVDLGELGVADRWWDLAVATWSLTWNLGSGYEALFLSEYGVEPRPDRIEFYRLLYDVVS